MKATLRLFAAAMAVLCAAQVSAFAAESKGDSLELKVQALHEELTAQKESLKTLREEYNALASRSGAEREKLYQELGVAYTKAKMFDAAVRTYEALLKINPKNAHAHYMLGLLYKQERNDSARSLEHLKKYLELCPAAPDRNEVEYLVKMLGRQ